MGVFFSIAANNAFTVTKVFIDAMYPGDNGSGDGGGDGDGDSDGDGPNDSAAFSLQSTTTILSWWACMSVVLFAFVTL